MMAVVIIIDPKAHAAIAALQIANARGEVTHAEAEKANAAIAILRELAASHGHCED